MEEEKDAEVDKDVERRKEGNEEIERGKEAG